MTQQHERIGLYGHPDRDLIAVPSDAIQFSPLVPGAEKLDAWPEATLPGMIVLAPPGTLERRYTLALALRALAPGASLTALAPRNKGGARLGEELRAFGCAPQESARRHHRICVCVRPTVLSGAQDAIEGGKPRFVEALGLWSQPGIFSWDRIDPGSALLAEQLPALSGNGADFGCGIGYLAHAVLRSDAVRHLTLIDIDRRAVEAAQHNVRDARVSTRWADLRTAVLDPASLDFVVMNPPFHDGGTEDRALGQSFIARAAEVLRPGGVCWLVANRHLPYEAALAAQFKHVRLAAEANGYKVYEAQR